MLRNSLPLNALPAWLALSNVEMKGVTISLATEGKGSGISTTEDISDEPSTLITVPRDLILSLGTIWEQAKSDHDLDQVLRATGDYGKVPTPFQTLPLKPPYQFQSPKLTAPQTPKGAILIFLLFQLTSTSPSATGPIGNANPWTTYIQYLPPTILLPTFYTPAETALLTGTTIAPALSQKLRALTAEFAHLRATTASLPCCAVWWAPGTGCLSFDDYLAVDAIYRSRAMDLPRTGLALVPVIDMANHASGAATNAHYDTDSNGNAVLVAYGAHAREAGREILITYGDDKGACEMLFSYGFIDPNLSTARTMFLDIAIPADDPLRHAKIAAFDAPPGFRLFVDPAKGAGQGEGEGDEKIAWYGPAVWLSCVNEEDGLEIRVARLNDGGTELQKSWKGRELADILGLERALERERMLDVFRLRAYVSMSARVREQLSLLEETYARFWGEGREGGDLEAREEVKGVVGRLGRLEGALLRMAVAQWEGVVAHLLNSRVVRKYLDSGVAEEEEEIEPVDEGGGEGGGFEW